MDITPGRLNSTVLGKTSQRRINVISAITRDLLAFKELGAGRDARKSKKTLSSKMRLYFMFTMTKAANIFACFYCFSHNTENFVLQHDNREQIMSLSLSFHHLVKYENIENANAKNEDCKPFGKGNSMNYGR
uniref:Uncharacterized protein n=1 Tax=Glossina palpalis gambiensis TaxID=67801 RepID=A0A1B0B3G7_9MUSC